MPDAKSMYWQLADDPYVLARTSERVSYLLEHGEDPPCSGWLDCTVERAKNVGGLYLNTSDGFMRGVIEPWKRGGRWYLDSWSSCFDGSFDGCANAVATTAIAAAGVALSVMTAGSAGVALAVWVSVVAQAATLSAAGQFHLDYDETALGRVDSAWREWAPRVLDPNRDRDARVRGETIRVSTPVQPGRRLLVPARPRSMPLPDHLRR